MWCHVDLYIITMCSRKTSPSSSGLKIILNWEKEAMKSRPTFRRRQRAIFQLAAVWTWNLTYYIYFRDYWQWSGSNPEALESMPALHQITSSNSKTWIIKCIYNIRIVLHVSLLHSDFVTVSFHVYFILFR